MVINFVIAWSRVYFLCHSLSTGSTSTVLVVMDNCSIHHVISVKKILAGVGILLVFQLPYSPDYNPIEFVFSKVKSSMQTVVHNVHENEDVVIGSFCTVTTEDVTLRYHNLEYAMFLR